MDILAATKAYESWLSKLISIHQPDLDYKHKQMADPSDPFPFFRGTYYRWAQHWVASAGDLAEAPVVLAVGDLHVENYGTWRDADGRLCWGVNDFDEADRLPYTQDLVRLAASMRFAKRAGTLDISLTEACNAILDGYSEALGSGGKPYVLEENHPHLRELAMAEEREPAHFWKKLTAVLDDPKAAPPASAREALKGSLPAEGLKAEIRFRPKVGMGSLGRPRFVALASWAGSWIAREVKAAVPSATAWAAGQAASDGSHLGEAAGGAIRSPDPFYQLQNGWVARRLGPRCSRIDLDHLRHAKDVQHLLSSMGAETANVHLGTRTSAALIQKDMVHRAEGWLETTARNIGELIEKDWERWREEYGK